MNHDRPDQVDFVPGQPVAPPSFAEVVDRLDRLWLDSPSDSAVAISPLVDRQIGRYALHRVLGRGAFGVVYLARDAELDREVALKVPRPEVQLDAEKLLRFQSEARTAAGLEHPLIVQVYEATFTGPTPYIASAFCKGPDLARWLEGRQAPVPPEQAAGFVAQVAEAVDFAHRQGVLHRDLKPGNILLEPLTADPDPDELESYQPRLTDFGLSKLLEASRQDTRSSLIVGTPLYMAPEQVISDGQSVTPAVDVYSLGILLHELLTLRTPFEGMSYFEILNRLSNALPIQMQTAGLLVPRDLLTICEKCLECDSKDRYQSANELRNDLQRYLSGDAPLATPVTKWRRWRRWCRRPERITAAGQFSCWLQMLIVVWVLATVGINLFFLRESIDPWRLLSDLEIVLVGGHLPMLVLGWLVWRGFRIAFIPAALVSVLFVGIMAFSITQQSVAFDYLYPTVVAKINTFVALVMASLLQAGMYALALPAWWRSRSDK